MRLRFKKLFIIFVLVGCINLPIISAQEIDLAPLGTKKPVMYSVFWNTLWGSAWGAAMGFSYHLVSGIKLRESPDLSDNDRRSTRLWTWNLSCGKRT